MTTTISGQCHACVASLQTIIGNSSESEDRNLKNTSARVVDELERFGLWMGNIGALHPPSSLLSLESRLREDREVLDHVGEVLGEVLDVAQDCENIFITIREFQ